MLLKGCTEYEDLWVRQRGATDQHDLFWAETLIMLTMSVIQQKHCYQINMPLKCQCQK